MPQIRINTDGGTASGGTLPFREAIAFFRQKKTLPSASWTQFWQGQHDRAFVVAGAMKQELVDDFFTTIDRLRTGGKSYKDFLDNFDRIVARHGWQYNGSRGWRSRVIWRTNMRTSYQAGRYQQMKAVVERRPFWQYHHSDLVAEPRPHHVRLDGTILRHDHPFWVTHYPPNGWGCLCYVTTHSARDLDRQGLSVSPDPEIVMRDVTVGTRGPFPRTVSVPEGIDPGWAYAPGKSWVEQAVERSVMSLDTAHEAVAQSGVMSAAHIALFERWFTGGSDVDFPLAVLPAAGKEAIGARSRVVRFSADTRNKQLVAHPELTTEDYASAQRVIDQGRMIRDGEQTLVYIHEAGSYVMVVKATRSGKANFMQSYRRLSSDEAKRDGEIRRLLRKEEE